MFNFVYKNVVFQNKEKIIKHLAYLLISYKH